MIPISREQFNQIEDRIVQSAQEASDIPNHLAADLEALSEYGEVHLWRSASGVWLCTVLPRGLGSRMAVTFEAGVSVEKAVASARKALPEKFGGGR